MGLVAAVVVAGVAGAGASVYGANKQSDAQSAANAANTAAVASQNQEQWNNYLLERGVNGNNAPTGTIPTNAQPVNAKLPLWANISASNGVPQGGRWVKAGTPTPATGFTLANQPGTNSPAGSVNASQSGSSAMDSYGT